MELSWHKKLFLYGNYLSYILFVTAFSGILYVSPSHLDTLTTILKYYVPTQHMCAVPTQHVGSANTTCMLPQPTMTKQMTICREIDFYWVPWGVI